jgi:hypothetical protein
MQYNAGNFKFPNNTQQFFLLQFEYVKIRYKKLVIKLIRLHSENLCLPRNHLDILRIISLNFNILFGLLNSK